MNKIKFNYEISIGHIVQLIGLIVAAAIYVHKTESDINLLKKSTEQHSIMIQEQYKIQEQTVRSLAVISALFDSHIEDFKRKERQ